jgi:hypothetical protein
MIALTDWLGVDFAAFRPVATNLTTPEAVELHLRADKKLNHTTAKALSELFRAAYDQLSKKK